MKDFTATSLIGPQATPAQIINASFVSCLYHCSLQLSKLSLSPSVSAILSPPIEALEAAYKRVTDALDSAIRKEVTSILGRMHRIDWRRELDPMTGSAYMSDLVSKLGFLRNEVLGRLALGAALRAWVLELARFVTRAFLYHASVVARPSESGKLKLTSNMTELEMALQNFLNVGRVPGQRNTVKLEAIGDEYAALRAFRQLLFADLDTLADPHSSLHLPPAVLCHCVLGRCNLSLPGEVHGWSEAEYVLWLLKHTRAEQAELIEKAVAGQTDGTEQAAKMIADTLKRAREEDEHERA